MSATFIFPVSSSIVSLSAENVTVENSELRLKRRKAATTTSISHIFRNLLSRMTGANKLSIEWNKGIQAFKNMPVYWLVIQNRFYILSPTKEDFNLRISFLAANLRVHLTFWI